MRIPYLREIGAVIAIAAFLAYSAWMYRMGGRGEQLKCAQAQNAQLQAQIEVTAQWQQRAYDADEALRKALEAPKAAPQIRTIIRENPSSCVVPAPVARGLRDAIRGGNKSISGQRG